MIDITDDELLSMNNYEIRKRFGKLDGKFINKARANAEIRRKASQVRNYLKLDEENQKRDPLTMTNEEKEVVNNVLRSLSNSYVILKT